MAAGLGLGAAGLAVGQRPVQAHIPRSIYDITRPIFNAEAQRRKILTLKDKCKTNLIGNGFHSMAYDLLFFALEELKIVVDTGHILNGEPLYVVKKGLVKKEIPNLKNTDFAKEMECYSVNENILCDFLIHYKNKAVVNNANKNKKLRTQKVQ